jgi:hypothetical protein
MDSQDSPRPGLGGRHHRPPYTIFCAWEWDQHPTVILSRDSQVAVPKFLKLRFLRLWRPITLCVDLQLRWGLKQSCSPHLNLSNGKWHATCTQGNHGYYQLLIVGSQIDNLTLDPSFGHNLCFKRPNGSCEPILNIHVPKAFQCYKYFFNLMNFDVATLFWKSVRVRLTFPKWGLGSPPGLPKLQSSIEGVKTPRLEVFFISLENYWSVDVENGLAWAIWTSTA